MYGLQWTTWEKWAFKNCKIKRWNSRYWLNRQEECLDKVIKSKRLEKIFEKEISQELYENIRGVILGDK